jgi:20S proteasome subunit alpha 7
VVCIGYVISNVADQKGYFGAAAGKGKQVAKNELEKLDLKNMTCREAVYKAAKMYFPLELD